MTDKEMTFEEAMEETGVHCGKTRGGRYSLGRSNFYL